MFIKFLRVSYFRNCNYFHLYFDIKLSFVFDVPRFFRQKRTNCNESINKTYTIVKYYKKQLGYPGVNV